MTCLACGRTAHPGAPGCSWCGAPLAQAATTTSAGTAPPVPDVAADTEFPEIEQTRLVDPAQSRPRPSLQAGSSADSNPQPQESAATSAPGWAAAQGTAAPLPMRERVVPPEVVVVGLALLALAGLFVYPFFSTLPDLVKGEFSSDDFVRAFSSVLLQVVALLFACAVALAALAVGLFRGNKAAQVLTCYLAGLVAFAELVARGQSSDTVAAPATGAVVGIVLCAVLIVVLLFARAGVREYFPAGPYPLGVTFATIVNVYVGSVALIDAVLFELAGAAGRKYVWIGLTLAVGGVGLLTTNRFLRAGRSGGRAVVLVSYGVVVIALGVSASSSHSWGSPSTLVPLGVIVAAAMWLLLAPTSQAHFHQSGVPRQTSPLALAATSVAMVGVLVCAVVGFQAASRSPLSGSGDGSLYASGDGSQYSPDPVTPTPDYPTDQPTYATGSSVNTDTYSWTITEQLADGSTAIGTLSVGDPTPYQSGIDNGSFTAGTGCSPTENDDAVIPVTFSVENRATSDEYVGLNFDGVGSDSLPGIDGSSMTFEASYSDGAVCNGGDDGSTTFGVQSTDTISADESTTVEGFFDISSFYTSSESNNTILDDAKVTVNSNQPTNGESATVTGVTGPGVVDNGDGSWSFTLGGVSP